MPSYQYADNYVGMQLGATKDKSKSSRTAIDAKNNRFLDRKMVSREKGVVGEARKANRHRIHKQGEEWELD